MARESRGARRGLGTGGAPRGGQEGSWQAGKEQGWKRAGKGRGGEQGAALTLRSRWPRAASGSP